MHIVKAPPGDYARKNLQKASFENEQLANASFTGSDLRGANFSGCDLTGADLSHVKTGITPFNTVFIFFFALIISMLSGYIAMLAGRTIQFMLQSGDSKVRAAGITSLVMIVLFIVYYYWKGGRSVIKHLLLPVFSISISIGIVIYLSGYGSGTAALLLTLALFLIVVMVSVGTVARVLGGVLSSGFLFIAVALGGGMFGKSVGGGVGTVIMAVSCALISKRALSGAKGFELLREIADSITHRFGTSFQNAKLTNANFSDSVIHNTDFTNAELSSVNWDDSKKENCMPLVVKDKGKDIKNKLKHL